MCPTLCIFVLHKSLQKKKNNIQIVYVKTENPTNYIQKAAGFGRKIIFNYNTVNRVYSDLKH